ncbi:glycosyltransferase family 4 protein [Lysobacter sp. LF1]|uniref:Glycosyltransferase family 4 protein n=1 Tax=Lysobacter stagni TaxID=3045172 RepID=A0ABT6XJB8_9GAMM|nr:glycosyltransferase family 4 protein [Lysobacter sp. LF1]MDI9240253.1 glycosyltransferase family 4 protein [Lysobacter sp. LF1]
MRIALFANTDWYLYNFRLSTAQHLQANGADVVMVSPPGEFGERFAEHGIRWVTLPMDRASLNPLREAFTVRHLTALLRRERPDLIHNFTVKCAVYGALAARLSGVPAVVNAVAGLGYVYASNGLKARVLRPVVSTLLRATLGHGASRVIVQNPDDAAALSASNLVSDDKIRLIRSSGVDVERFQPSEPDDAQRPLRVLLAARLLREKGVAEFVEASRMLQVRGRNVEFLLAGTPDPGNPSSFAREEVEQWGRKGLVRWLGHVDDMPALLASVDVMALPSYYREGVPRCLIEGAASGLCLITTDLPGCREVVTRHGEDGLQVPPRDAPSLAALLMHLDDDRATVHRLGAKARERAVAHFDERLVIGRTLDVYEELLSTPLPARVDALECARE